MLVLCMGRSSLHIVPDGLPARNLLKNCTPVRSRTGIFLLEEVASQSPATSSLSSLRDHFEFLILRLNRSWCFVSAAAIPSPHVSARSGCGWTHSTATRLLKRPWRRSMLALEPFRRYKRSMSSFTRKIRVLLQTKNGEPRKDNQSDRRIGRVE